MDKKCVIDIETESLDPKEGRIICIGVKEIGGGRSVVFYDENEEQMLRDFLDYFHNRGFNEIVGYNILFDIRYVFARCLKHDLPSNGFFKASYTDLMHIMKSVKNAWSMNKPGKLGEWSEFLFGSGKIPLSENIREKFERGKIGEIIEYNKRDLEITFMLWERIQKVLGNGY